MYLDPLDMSHQALEKTFAYTFKVLKSHLLTDLSSIITKQSVQSTALCTRGNNLRLFQSGLHLDSLINQQLYTPSYQ